MNLGPIKDKSSAFIPSKRTLKKTVTITALSCVAVMAVFFSSTLKKDEQVPTISLPTPTVAVETGADSSVTTPAPPRPTAGSSSSADADSSIDNGISGAVSGEATVKAAMLSPINKCSLVKGYAADSLVYSQTLKHWSTHEGIDLACDEGTLCLAALDGTVSSITEDALMGLTVTVAHADGVETVYSCLESVEASVTEGTSIMRGQAIGTVGSSGASEAAEGVHLHFEVRKNASSQDPLKYLEGTNK